jgi:hypothetical protein
VFLRDLSGAYAHQAKEYQTSKEDIFHLLLFDVEEQD